jgi:hypothetical protein
VNSIPSRTLERQRLIQLHEENLIDCETVVNDARRDVDRAVEDFQQAVAMRDTVIRHLAALIEAA